MQQMQLIPNEKFQSTKSLTKHLKVLLCNQHSSLLWGFSSEVSIQRVGFHMACSDTLVLTCSSPASLLLADVPCYSVFSHVLCAQTLFLSLALKNSLLLIVTYAMMLPSLLHLPLPTPFLSNLGTMQ